jgi:hypothetical protein
MRYLPLILLAVLMMGLIVGCANTGTPEPIKTTTPTTATAAGTTTATVATEAGNAVDSTVIDDSQEVQIGEMI